MRRAKLIVVMVSAAMVGSVLGAVYSATAHSGCTVLAGPPTVYQGDEHQNSCYGGSGWDSLYGFGDNDTLGGETGADQIRGATGNDTLTDGAGSDDADSVCDGSGSDIIRINDGDFKDNVDSPDGIYGIQKDDGDRENIVASCPF
jgi:Ca2+-binding RTX toxin-like protein